MASVPRRLDRDIGARKPSHGRNGVEGGIQMRREILVERHGDALRAYF